MVVRAILKAILVLMLVSSTVSAQDDRQRTFVRTAITVNDVQLKQPFDFRITVYTDTWFSSAPNLDNIVIPGALTVKRGRAQGGNETINNQNYTVLSFEFLVFPGVSGELQIPAIELNYSTPKPGDFKGVPVTRSTEPITLTVRQPASGYDPSSWVVADDIKLSVEWDKALTNLKVGDVLQRTIRISARGTLAALLPAIEVPEIEWGSVYARSPVLVNEIGLSAINSTRTDITTFLLEKPGEFEIPPVRLNWWQPSAAAVRSSETKRVTLKVIENPDLMILQTLQDSLQLVSSYEQGQKPDTTTLFWFPVVSRLAVALVLLVLIYRSGTALIIRIWDRVQSRRQAYLNSEACLFDQLKRCGSEDILVFYNLLKAWTLKICPESGGSLESFADLYGSHALKVGFKTIQRALFFDDGQQKIKSDVNSLIVELTQARNRIIKKVQPIQTEHAFHLNPR